MTYLTDRYVNFFTDYGFKRLFGEEPHKDLLRDFLNELLKDEQGQIVDLTYLKDENLGNTSLDRKAIFDLYCENERGEKFIVELQKAKQNFFKDRSVFYATFPIQHQAQRGDWNFELKAVYTIGILDFVFEEDRDDPEKYRYDIKLQDIVTNKVFYDKLTFIYLALPKFQKNLDQLETRFEKWLYAIKHLDRLDKIPDALREQIFEKFFQVAEIANFSRDEIQKYEDSLKYYRDLKNVLDTARDEGREEATLNVARNLLDVLNDETIALKTGLTVKQVAGLRSGAVSR
ncbi:Rpn family recombination-promoting nuclease/putative transposase [Desulfonatronovibrio magnus]|uniref:Rpn family recombination-promoting nuclease/putative transposase n=1 Tax=Desulfonatronovibrio magnus TaxID=698827 RepID=UPI0005EBD1A1|nr:Rpn family recombination-promoting nuclease/putative transposase [Desulfonatronovibrio magnus]